MSNLTLPNNNEIYGTVQEDSLYRLDESILGTHTWLERIEFINGEVYYTEDYVCVENSKIQQMINESQIKLDY